MPRASDIFSVSSSIGAGRAGSGGRDGLGWVGWAEGESEWSAGASLVPEDGGFRRQTVAVST